MKNYFNELKNWLKNVTKAKEQKAISMQIEPAKVVRKHEPVTKVTKGGKAYRVIKHDAYKKANSPAYTQLIWLKTN